MPLSVLAGVDINLSPEMMQAVKAVTYSNSAKMGLAMKRRFWEEDDQIFGGHLYSNLPLGEFSYPSNDYFSQEGRAARSLRERAGRRPARPAGQGARRARADAREQGASADPQEFESAYAVWWRKVKYSQGGYATGARAARRAQLSKVDNRILIGSAATAPYSEPDWQEGAVAAGWQALKSLHERAMKA